NVIELPPERQALLVAANRFREVIGEKGQCAEARQTGSDAPHVAKRAGNDQCLVVMTGCIGEAFLPECDVAEIAPSNSDARAIILSLIERQRRFVSYSGFGNVAAIVHLDDAKVF